MLQVIFCLMVLIKTMAEDRVGRIRSWSERTVSSIMKGIIVAFVSLVLSVTGFTQSIIRGTVFDMNDAVIPGLIIRASNQREVVESTSNADGEFIFRLFAGIYMISTREAYANDWYPVRRSLVSIAENQDYEVLLWPKLRVLMRSLEVTNRGPIEPVSISRRPKYREFSFKDEPKIKLVLQYDKGDRTGKLKEIMVTYDRYTIRADSAIIRSSSRTILLEGAVRLYINSKPISSDQAVIKLDRKRPAVLINGDTVPLTSRKTTRGGSGTNRPLQ